MTGSWDKRKDKNKDFLGKSMSYPCTTGVNGDIQTQEEVENIKSSFRYFLAVQKDDLPMTDFGNNAKKYLFDPNDASLITAFAGELQKDLNKWMPRIKVLDIQGITSPNKEDAIQFKIFYQIVNTDIIDSEVIIV